MTSCNNEALVNKIEILVNDMVSIHCYTNASIDIQWHFNSLLNYVFTGRRLRHPYKERFRTEDDNAGTYILIIPRVKSEDAGWYYCSEEETGRRISSTHLTVLLSKLTCHSSMHSDGFIGPNNCNLQQENMIFNCVVSFNGTSPHLTWRSLNNSRPLNSSICVDKPNRRNCSLILKSDPVYDGSIFICQTTASIDSSFNCSNEVIKIQYFSTTTDSAKKYVNDNVICSENSNLNVRYNWTLKQNNKVAFLSSNQNLVIQKPGIYQCEVNYGIRNYSCLSIASVMNVSGESTSGGIISESSPICGSNMKPQGFVGPNTCKLEQEYMTFTCSVSFNGKPPQMIWTTLNDSQSFNESTCKLENGRNNCSLVLRAEAKSDGTIFNCQSTESSANCNTDIIKIHYFESEFLLVEKNIKDTVNCSVKSNQILQFTWNQLKGNQYVTLVTNQTLLIPSPGVYRCIVEYRIRNTTCSAFGSEVNVPKTRIYHYETEHAGTAATSVLSIIVIICIAVIIAGLYRFRRKTLKQCWKNDEQGQLIGQKNDVSGNRENERIKNKVVEMLKDIVDEIDPNNVLDLLIARRIINVEYREKIMNKETKKDRCRALIFHLLECSHNEAFIVFRKALEEHYHWIVERIDAFDTDNENQDNFNKKVEQLEKELDATKMKLQEVNRKTEHLDNLQKIMETQLNDVKREIEINKKENETLKHYLEHIKPKSLPSGKQENERIRNRVAAIYEDFVSEVYPKKILDFLIEHKIVNLKQINYLKRKVTTEEQCEVLLDLLYSCSEDNVFIILKESLKEHYPGIVERIDCLTIDYKYRNNSDKRSTVRLESFIVVFGEVDAFKINLNRPDEVSVLQKLPIEVYSSVSSAVYCGSIFVTGGGRNADKIWRFDARYSKWNKCASLIKGRSDHSVAFVDHILYICGGWSTYYAMEPSEVVHDGVEAYDAIDDKCSAVGKLNYAVKCAGNCVLYKASLYIFGGTNAWREILNIVQVYDTKLNSCTILTNSIPRNNYLLCCALFKHYFIFMGNESCFLYNFDTETLEVRDQFKTGFKHFGMTVHNGNLFVIGGRVSMEIRRDNVRYVPIMNILNDEPVGWKYHAKLPKPFAVHAFGKMEFLSKQV